MQPLRSKKCVPCEDKSVPPLSQEEAEVLMEQLSGWLIVKEGKCISKTWLFSDFMDSLTFVNSVGSLAEEEGHHPDIYISYNKVVLELMTYSLQGLSENDFILAAKIDDMLRDRNMLH